MSHTNIFLYEDYISTEPEDGFFDPYEDDPDSCTPAFTDEN